MLIKAGLDAARAAPQRDGRRRLEHRRRQRHDDAGARRAAAAQGHAARRQERQRRLRRQALSRQRGAGRASGTTSAPAPSSAAGETIVVYVRRKARQATTAGVDAQRWLARPARDARGDDRDGEGEASATKTTVTAQARRRQELTAARCRPPHRAAITDAQRHRQRSAAIDEGVGDRAEVDVLELAADRHAAREPRDADPARRRAPRPARAPSPRPRR